MNLIEMDKAQLLKEYFSASDEFAQLTGGVSLAYSLTVTPEYKALKLRLKDIIGELSRRRRIGA